MKLRVFDNNRNARTIEHGGFFNGAHGISPENDTAEIDAAFERKIHEAKQKSLTKKKRLEAALDRLTAIAPEIERAWQSAQDSISPEHLRLVMPIVVLVLGLSALTTEVILLAPSLDLLDITDPDLQLVGAFGIVAMASVILHLAWETIDGHGESNLWRIVWRIFGGLGALALILWGTLRGYQVAFAADISENQLGRFLAGHPVLASIFYIFITLGAPLAAAGALSYGSRHLHEWFRYRKAKKQAAQLAQKLSEARRWNEAETEWLQ
ncbi:MAG: hypothetical protein ACYCOU_11670, partial [Sulfobacillus sp.]